LKSKPFVCSSLKPTFKSRQNEVCYTFNVAKCDRIFIICCKKNKLNYQVIMLYHHRNSCKCATNDCNVFRHQVQSVTNEGRLKFDKSPQMKHDNGEYKHGRARREESHDLAISGRINQSEKGYHRRGKTAEDAQAQKSRS
jgi:hypothetical protein